MRILAIHAGAEAVRAAVLDVVTAEPVGPIAEVTFPVHRPVPEPVETTADDVWAAVATAARRVTRDGPPVAGVGLACVCPVPVFLGAHDEPLRPLWLPADRRSRPAARHVTATVGPAFLAATGSRPLPGRTAVLAYRQLVTEDPYLFRQVRRLLFLNGWLTLRLTGEAACDPASASASGLFTTCTDRQWSNAWCDYFEVGRDWLPPVVDGATTIGTLRSGPAAELGLLPGLPVKLGIDEGGSAALAVSLRADDLLYRETPTPELLALAPDATADARRQTRLLGVGGDYLRVAPLPVAESGVEWLRQLAFADVAVDDFWARLVPEAVGRATRVTLDPPYLGGDGLEVEALRASFRDLTLSTDRFDLLAAVLAAGRRGWERAAATLGVPSPGCVHFAGGSPGRLRQCLSIQGDRRGLLHENAPLLGIARLFVPGSAT